MSECFNHIVIDSGSCYTKSGYNGENAPRSVIPTIYGQFSTPNKVLTEENNKKFIGRDCISSCILDVDYPIQNGKVKNWDQLEAIWEYVFTEELKISPDAHSVFLLESLYASDEDKEKAAQIMFEKFKIFNYHTEAQPIMTLYSTTKSIGLVVELGAGSMQIVPIYEGYIINNGVTCIDLGGDELTKALRNNLTQKFKKYKIHNELEYSRIIKEQLMEISQTALTGSENLNIQKTYELPDGNKISLGDELIKLSEGYFCPEVINFEGDGIHQLIIKCIDSLEITFSSASPSIVPSGNAWPPTPNGARWTS
jgi:actin-related protein